MPDKLVLQVNQQPPTEAVANTKKARKQLKNILYTCKAEAKAIGLPLTVYQAFRKHHSVVPRLLPRPLPAADMVSETSKSYSEENKRNCRPM